MDRSRRSVCQRATWIAAILLVGCGDDASDVEWKDLLDPAPESWLMNVAIAPDHDAWIVGGNPNEGLALHERDGAFVEVEVPDGTRLVNWTMPFASDDAFLVGNGGVVLHWDGEALTPMESATTEDLWGVWGARPDDVWAVGGSGFPEATATVVHFDGDAWERVETPELERAEVHAFFKVWGASADDVWVVGQRGAVLHYDGDVWEEELVGTSEDLIAVWGAGPDRVMMIGGRSNGVAVTWDGATFHAVDLAPLPGLNGVWTDDGERFFVAGTFGTLATVDFALTDIVDERATPTSLTYHALSGDSSRRFVVGGSLANPTAPFEGIARTREETR